MRSGRMPACAGWSARRPDPRGARLARSIHPTPRSPARPRALTPQAFSAGLATRGCGCVRPTCVQPKLPQARARPAGGRGPCPAAATARASRGSQTDWYAHKPCSVACIENQSRLRWVCKCVGGGERRTLHPAGPLPPFHALREGSSARQSSQPSAPPALAAALAVEKTCHHGGNGGSPVRQLGRGERLHHGGNGGLTVLAEENTCQHGSNGGWTVPPLGRGDHLPTRWQRRLASSSSLAEPKQDADERGDTSQPRAPLRLGRPFG